MGFFLLDLDLVWYWFVIVGFYMEFEIIVNIDWSIVGRGKKIWEDFDWIKWGLKLGLFLIFNMEVIKVRLWLGSFKLLIYLESIFIVLLEDLWLSVRLENFGVLDRYVFLD